MMVDTGKLGTADTLAVSVTYFDAVPGCDVTEKCEGRPATVAAFLRAVADRVDPQRRPAGLIREAVAWEPEPDIRKEYWDQVKRERAERQDPRGAVPSWNNS